MMASIKEAQIEVDDKIKKYICQLELKVANLEHALKPFTHDDLCELFGGNCKGIESPVFQRNNALLLIKDFRLARSLLYEKDLNHVTSN